MAATLTETLAPWACRDRTLDLSQLPLLMGILNVTPDSFSDGGQFLDCDAAVAHGLQMMQNGADIIDVGGESTRPGSIGVSIEEECERTQQVVRALAGDHGALVSIDSTKTAVARAALDAGACIVNDVSACEADPDMISLVAETGAGVVLMHRQGTPDTMQKSPRYEHVVEDVERYLLGRAAQLESGGVGVDRIVLDPGIGFGKLPEHNVGLLAEIERLVGHGYPVLVGLSRKSFLGELTGRDVDQRLAGSLAGALHCRCAGVAILRVHDVAETRDALRVYGALCEGV